MENALSKTKIVSFLSWSYLEPLHCPNRFLVSPAYGFSHFGGQKGGPFGALNLKVLIFFIVTLNKGLYVLGWLMSFGCHGVFSLFSGSVF